MPTAEIVADGLDGFVAPATLYRIDPPIQGTDHVLVYHRPPMFGQPGQMTVVLSTPGGVGYGRRMDPVDGTYTTNEPNHHLALQLAGGYRIVDSEPASELYDPGAHTVAEVLAYLAEVDPDERDRALEAERNGKARKGILGGE